jgi:hypothetical protein
MFRSNTAAASAPGEEVPPSSLVPLSVLRLEMDPVAIGRRIWLSVMCLC